MSQDPNPGQLVKKGRKIYLSVSTVNPPQVEMPNLIDLSLRQAENMLKTNNLRLGQVVPRVAARDGILYILCGIVDE